MSSFQMQSKESIRKGQLEEIGMREGLHGAAFRLTEAVTKFQVCEREVELGWITIINPRYLDARRAMEEANNELVAEINDMIVRGG